MKVLFLARHFTYFRNFESVLRELASRGHQLHLAVERDESLGGTKLTRSLVDDFPNVTAGLLPERSEHDWTWTAIRLRLGLDYLRYQHPVFDRAYKLRERSRGRTPGAFVALGHGVHAAGEWARRGAETMLRRMERAIPETASIRAFVEAQRPNVMLLTPLIDLGSSQIDYLRAARALGIPTALCVWSWDHLSSKALIRECPDRVFVWNETQKREATELHRVPPERVVVTGAQCFDHWFDRAPSRTREEFCNQIGLDATRPFLLWVCSALIHGSAPEAPFVVEWIRRLRASDDPVLRGIGVLVRPHPSRVAEWESIDISQLNAVVWGSNPIDEHARADYFDSIFHSAAVVGLNTSAFIEAGIVGRPVLTIVVPEFVENQHGTVHFDYLVTAGGGLVTVGNGFDEHLAQLESAVAAPVGDRKPFVRDFVRPLGLDRPATPVFVNAVEAMQGLRIEPFRTDAFAPVWRWTLRRIAALKDNQRFERWTLSPREQVTAERRRTMREQKAIRRALSRAANDANRQRKLQEREARFETYGQQRQESRALAAVEGKIAAIQPNERVPVRKACVLIGSRANYGSIKSAMRAIASHPELKLQLVVAASALLDRFGSVVEVIEADGFTPDAKVAMIVEGETPSTMAKSTGLGLLELPTVFDHLKPDVVISVGDRFETMATAVAASYMNIPVAHTMGGEISGTIDESIRHAVTKLAHVHFPANRQAGERIVRMGEDPSTVHVVGCPRVDLVAQIVLSNGHIDSADWLDREGAGAHITLDEPFLLVSQHPVTTEYGQGERQINETLAALDELRMPTIMLWPNADAGSEDIARGMRKFRENRRPEYIRFYKNFPIETYVRLMNSCACAIGNSSAPVREGAFIGVPTVNVGTRQCGRDRGSNVVDVGHDRAHIVGAVKRQIAHGRYPSDHLYGDGEAGPRIANVLATAALRVQKRLHY